MLDCGKNVNTLFRKMHTWYVAVMFSLIIDTIACSWRQNIKCLFMAFILRKVLHLGLICWMQNHVILGQDISRAHFLSYWIVRRHWEANTPPECFKALFQNRCLLFRHQDSQYKGNTVTWYHLIFKMKIPVLSRPHIYIKMAPMKGRSTPCIQLTHE